MSIVKFVKIAVSAAALTAFTLPMLGTAEALTAGNQTSVAKKDQKQVKKTAKTAKKDTKDVKKASAKKVAKKPAAKKTAA